MEITDSAKQARPRRLTLPRGNDVRLVDTYLAAIRREIIDSDADPERASHLRLLADSVLATVRDLVNSLRTPPGWSDS